jgi:L-ascorbate metabolism protein UlaG (beta-lactamase superfamily)
MTLAVTRVTHPCVLLNFGGQVLLTDPWFSVNGATPAPPPDAPGR